MYLSPFTHRSGRSVTGSVLVIRGASVKKKKKPWQRTSFRWGRCATWWGRLACSPRRSLSPGKTGPAPLALPSHCAVIGTVKAFSADNIIVLFLRGASLALLNQLQPRVQLGFIKVGQQRCTLNFTFSVLCEASHVHNCLFMKAHLRVISLRWPENEGLCCVFW